MRETELHVQGGLFFFGPPVAQLGISQDVSEAGDHGPREEPQWFLLKALFVGHEVL